ncbi:MAG: double-strand break repair protein AddB [Pseudomonadota bacterium]
MSGASKPKLYTIPSENGFIDTLASGLLDRHKGAAENLSKYRILLPTRRACRALRDAFLKQSHGQPLLLPIMQPIGDIDEDELMIRMADINGLYIPPAISPLQRQILLARTIQAIGDLDISPDQAMALAQALGQFMDQILIEGLSLDVLDKIVPEDFAEHWQITIDFLKILSEHWPKILEENGVIDAADRRNRLVNALNQLWQNEPPTQPIIAAGSTGTVPATRALLKTIAHLEHGEVILPGLDVDIDEESWNSLNESHPQHSLKELLDELEFKPADIPYWEKTQTSENNSRADLLREIMRPAETTAHWARLQPDQFGKALEGIEYFACDTQQDEAMLIALKLRETLETPEKTAALVTPDRALARRVALICRKWGIELDDSGGRSLTSTYRGSFFTLCLDCVSAKAKPVALLSLLKHGLCKIDGFDAKTQTAIVAGLDKDFLRGNVAYNDIYGFIEDNPNLSKNQKNFLKQIDKLLDPLTSLLQQPDASFQDFLKAHIQLAENLSGEDTIWVEEDGEALAALLSELLAHAHLFPPLSFSAYSDILEQLMAQASVRPTYGTHPRLMILGQLEARMVRADVMILSGLNEGSWPPDVGHDPWMSRPMRKTYGLPSMDMRVGLSAHDFGQCFCAKHVVLTRAERTQGTQSVPSRWLQRLDTILKAMDMSLSDLSKGPYKSWVSATTAAPESISPYLRPAPTPPKDKRPKTLPVTAVESWVRDPYALYAKYILNLRKLDDLEEDMSAALRGSLVHDIFDRFIKTYPENLPYDSSDILMGYAIEAVGVHADEPGFWAFWKPRFERMIDWFIEHETEWRESAKPGPTEVKGTYSFDDLVFTLTAKADRIDSLKDSQAAAIIDYKTGQPPTTAEVRAGLAPQLPLEALIALGGGFPDIVANDIGYMGFWRLSGGSQAGDDVPVKPKKDEELSDFIESARDGLKTLIETFENPDTPYYSLPRPNAAPRTAYQNYAHLARVQEWAALDDPDGGS